MWPANQEPGATDSAKTDGGKPDSAQTGPDEKVNAGSSSPVSSDVTVGQDENEQQRRLEISRGELIVPPVDPEGYNILERLGQGTFGEVWRARRKITNVEVAIKFLHIHSSSQLATLKDEANKLALLNAEPGIVHLLDLAEHPKHPYFVMDFAENGSLAQLLAKGPLPVREALRIWRRIIDAMAYVHAKGMKHCDLKPGNILLDAAGRPKVADFGQAHISLEPHAVALGTFFYMAPEQAATDKKAPSPAWDVYSLGAILYVMVVGHPPHFDTEFKRDLESTQQLSHRLERYRERVSKGARPNLHRNLPDMDRDLAEIIDRCLAIEPSNRYRDAGEIQQALENRTQRRRMKPLIWFGFLAPLLLVSAMGVFGYLLVSRSISEAETKLLNAKQYNDQVTAELVSKVVEGNLDRLSGTLELFSRSDRLKDALIAYLPHWEKLRASGKWKEEDRDPEELKKLEAVEDFLHRIGNYEKDVVFFTVFDRDGVLLANYVAQKDKSLDDEKRKILSKARYLQGKHYSWRDYYHRGGADDYKDKDHLERQTHQFHPYPAGKKPLEEQAYLGQPYVSTLREKFLAVPISMPIYQGQERIGLILCAVEMRSINEWVKPVEKNTGCVVLLDEAGHCLRHRPEFEELIIPKPGENPPVWKDKSPTFQKVLEGEKGFNPSHRDPMDQRPVTYMAAYHPMPEIGGGVIVQHDQNEIAKDIREIQNGLFWLTGVAAALSGVILSIFWGWLLFGLRRREVPLHG